ncbi:MAG TPA: hypothetical protein PL155_02955 [Candidatus Omnitrophota bacterium]|nr:hypothetical protein [Candidatus Omnitrophota bacterium]HPD84558.1 hypothetical protein [Candidatus Omnitrophota bacterium]HRZ03416.1 hypothetical protein [Candidatus Omnitrophota bacterium]
MSLKWLCVCLVSLMLFVSGCETAKGFGRDVTNTWHGAQNLDEWVKEHLW